MEQTERNRVSSCQANAPQGRCWGPCRCRTFCAGGALQMRLRGSRSVNPHPRHFVCDRQRSCSARCSSVQSGMGLLLSVVGPCCCLPMQVSELIERFAEGSAEREAPLHALKKALQLVAADCHASYARCATGLLISRAGRSWPHLCSSLHAIESYFKHRIAAAADVAAPDQSHSLMPARWHPPAQHSTSSVAASLACRSHLILDHAPARIVIYPATAACLLCQRISPPSW
jgi:hypothetical protein